MVDLAAGTGRLTRVLVGLGCDVVAVEPVAEMRAHIEDAHVFEGTAEDTSLPTGIHDAVFSGEAFHWFDASRALPEIARVLRPRGGLALLWNVGLPQEDEAWRAEVAELVADIYYHPKGRTVPSAAGNDWREDVEYLKGPGWELFDPITKLTFEHEQTQSVADYRAFVSSWSFVAALKERKRDKLLDSIAAVLERHGVESFVQRWRTDLYLTRKVG